MKFKLQSCLNVDKSCLIEEVKSAQKKLALLQHPDKNPNGAETFKEISVAQAILSDPIKRERQDQYGDIYLEETDVFYEGVDFFKSLFNQVNKDSINDQLSNYYNSETELSDIKNQIIQNKGKVRKFFSDVIGAEQIDFDRYIRIIDKLKKNLDNQILMNLNDSIVQLKSEQIKEKVKNKKKRSNIREDKFKELELAMIERKKNRKNDFLDALANKQTDMDNDEEINFGKDKSKNQLLKKNKSAFKK